MQDRKQWNPVILMSTIGAVTGCCFLFYAFITAFGICSDTFIAEALFPYAVIADPSLTKYILCTLLLALIQWPLYGFLLGLMWARIPARSVAISGGVLILIIIHVLAVGVAHKQVEIRWGQRLNHLSVLIHPSKQL